jgi:hypothetical protein
MKTKSLAVLAGVGAPLILTAAASAGFVGIKAVTKVEAQSLGLFVCNIYAVFDRPDDEMIAVAGTSNSPLNIFAKAGNFYQDPQGAPLTAPFLQFLPGVSGKLAYDTFLTIGTKVNDLFTTLDDVSTTPGLVFTPNAISTQNGSWFILPSGPGNGGLGQPNANGQVLLGQFTIDKATVPQGQLPGVAGTMLLQFTSNGVAGQQAYVEFDHQVPAPGALALLGLGAAVGARRRRR